MAQPNWKRKEYRNKKILEACHDMGDGCTVQLPGCCGPMAPTVAAHSNLMDDGKGKSIKADDIFVAQACQFCHDVLDGRHKIEHKLIDFTRDLLIFYHDRGIKRTIRRMLDKGILK